MRHISSLARKLGEPSKSVNMTQGGICRTILAFALPIMIGNLFQQLYNMVDTAVVGRGVGPEALAAVGAASPVTQLLLGLLIGMTSGMSVVIARCFGAGDEARMKRAIATGALLIGAIGIAVTVAGALLCRALFELIHTPEDILDGAVEYSVILFLGAVATAAYNYEANVMRAFGNSAVPLLFLIVASLLNVGLDLLFVFPLGWGIAGAAIATVLSQLISAVLCLAYMARRVPQVRLARSDWKWDGALAAEHLRTGVPMAFFSSLLAISFLILQSALNSLGSADVAAYTAASKMDTLVYQVMAAFGTAISTFAAQNYGSGSIGRIREGVRRCTGITVAVCAGLTAFAQLFGRFFMLLFVGPEDAGILASGLMYMRTTSVLYVVLGVNYVIRFALIGVGKSAIPMLVGLSEIATRAAVTYLLVYRIGFAGMAFASPACWVTSTILCGLCYAPMMHSAEGRLRAAPAESAKPRPTKTALPRKNDPGAIEGPACRAEEQTCEQGRERPQPT